MKSKPMEDSDVPIFADIWSPSQPPMVLPESHSTMMRQSWNGASQRSYFPRLENSIHSPAPPQPVRFESLPYQPSLVVRDAIAPFPPSIPNRPPSSHQSQHLPRNPSHLDLPNFPLPRPYDVQNPERQDEDSYHLYGRDLGSSPFHLPSFDALPSNPLTSVSRPGSRLSWASEGSSLLDFPSWTTSQLQEGFIDLTAEPSPPTMSTTNRKRPASTLQASTRSSITPSASTKRKRTGGLIKREIGKIEEVDLRDVDDDNGLSQVLEQQRLTSIKAQQELADKPVNFSNLQCIICMESMTDATVTHCGECAPNGA